jgi:amidophosphoribosyltransferase
VYEQDHRHINTQSDSEVLLNVLAHELLEQGELSPASAHKAVEGVHRRVCGGYSVVATVFGLGLLAFRDPNGIRPLVIGRRESALGAEYAIASESAALDILGFTRLRDVAPGEAVVVTEQGELLGHQAAPGRKHTPCIFEFVYFARPDSMMDDISVHKARMRMGVKLGEKILRLRPDHDIDTVIPIPDTSRCGSGNSQFTGRQIPRRLHQEPLHRPYLHHARAEPARRVGEAQAQSDTVGVQGPRGAAGRRFHRARHHLAADRADGP